MAFNISYVFTARDRYTPTAKKIIRSQNALKRATDSTGKSFIRKNAALRKVAASLLIARRRLRSYNKETIKSNKASSVMITKFKQIAALAIIGLGIAKIVGEGAKLEDAMADLAAITGITGDGLIFMKKQVTALSVETRTLPAEVATAFKAVASAKSELIEDPQGLTEVTRQVLLLKNAAGIDMAQAVDAVTTSLNQFGAGADQAAKFVNILAAGAKVGASEIAETAAAVKLAGVAAKLAKLPFEDFNALIQIMAKNGIKAERAGTELNAFLLKLEVTMGNSAPSIIGVSKSLQVLKDMNLSTAESMKLVGLESIDVLSILTSNIPLLDEWTKAITGTNEAQRQAAIRLKTFNSLMLAAKIGLVNIAAAIFVGARPALVSLGNTMNSFIESLDPADVEVFSLALSALARVAQGVGLVIRGAFEIVIFVLKPVLATLKAIGEIIGQVAGAIATLNFSKFDLSGLFDIGGKTLGLFGGGDDVGKASPATATANATATVNGQINVSASPGSQIDSVESNNIFSGATGNVGLGVTG